MNRHSIVFLVCWVGLLRADVQYKELVGKRIQRDPFCWVQEKKKPTPAPVAQKKVEKKPEIPWQVCGVSLCKEGDYALFSCKNETKIVRVQQEVCSGWRVEKITPTIVCVRHNSGERKELTL